MTEEDGGECVGDDPGSGPCEVVDLVGQGFYETCTVSDFISMFNLKIKESFRIGSSSCDDIVLPIGVVRPLELFHQR